MKLLSKANLIIFIAFIVTIKQTKCSFFTPPSTPAAHCPPARLFYPCECYLHADSMKIIRCGGDTSYELSTIFDTLSDQLLGSEQKHFHMFYLNNTAIAALGNVFRDITFDYIYFDGANNLQAIHANAFDITGQYVKELRAFGTKLKQSSLEELLRGMSNLQHLTVSNVGQCPPVELPKPCKCIYRSAEWQWVKAKFTRIVCGEDSEEDLASVLALSRNLTHEQIGFYTMRRIQIFFDRLSDSLARINWQKRFDEFVIQHSPISELPRHMFNDIIFYAIRVDNCPNLHAIHPLAFTITEPFVQELLIRRTKLANDRWKQRDTFNAITSLSNLRVLYLHWSGLQSIPHHAFRPLKGRFQRKLVKISIKYENIKNHSLRMVGSYAFYYLPNLRTIDLSMNSIVKIYRNAFSLRWPSNEPLEINLSGNNLTDNSIEPSAFSEAQRPVHVILGQWLMGNPYLTHLDEMVFRTFLKENAKNRVRLHSSQHSKGGNRIICDCQSRWLFDRYGRMRQGLEDVMCVSNTGWQCLPPCLIYGQDVLHCGSTQPFNISETFKELSVNLGAHETHFIKFVLSNTEIETIPAHAFANITFEQLEFDGCKKLREIDESAFKLTANYLSQIVIRNTAMLSRWPSNSFRLSMFPNLTHLDLSFDGDFRLFNDTFEPSSGVESNLTLFIRLNRDNIRNDSIDTNAFNAAKRPINLFFDSKRLFDSRKGIVDPIGCQYLRLEESIYAQFLANNPYNEINVIWCPIMCDCSIKWLFDAPQDWWRRVDAGDPTIGLQCHDHRSLHFYGDNDFRNCPKTNLLKYLVKESAFPTITTTSSNTNTTVNPQKFTNYLSISSQTQQNLRQTSTVGLELITTAKAISTEKLATESSKTTTTEVMPQEISVYSEWSSDTRTDTPVQQQLLNLSTTSVPITLTTKEEKTFTESQYTTDDEILNVRTHRYNVETVQQQKTIATTISNFETIQQTTTTTIIPETSFTNIKLDEEINSVFSGISSSSSGSSSSSEEGINEEIMGSAVTEVNTIGTESLDTSIESLTTTVTQKQYDNQIEYRTVTNDDIAIEQQSSLTTTTANQLPTTTTLRTTDRDKDIDFEIMGTRSDILVKMIQTTNNKVTNNNDYLNDNEMRSQTQTSTEITPMFTDIILDNTSVFQVNMSTESSQSDNKYIDRYIDYDSIENSERVSTMAASDETTTETTFEWNKTSIELSVTTTASAFIDNTPNKLYRNIDSDTETVSTHVSSAANATVKQSLITITGSTTDDTDDNIDYLTLEPAN